MGFFTVGNFWNLQHLVVFQSFTTNLVKINLSVLTQRFIWFLLDADQEDIITSQFPRPLQAFVQERESHLFPLWSLFSTFDHSGSTFMSLFQFCCSFMKMGPELHAIFKMQKHHHNDAFWFIFIPLSKPKQRQGFFFAEEFS